MVALAVNTGQLPLDTVAGITASSTLDGTRLDCQLPGTFQEVLTVPVQVAGTIASVMVPRTLLAQGLFGTAVNVRVTEPFAISAALGL
jgi:hypothetical protein